VKILLTGGGTGGHITPLLAVAHELKNIDPSARLVYVGEKGGKFDHIVAESKALDDTRKIYAGKFRRYHGESLWQQLTDIKTIFLNIRDAFLFGFGTLQAIGLMWRERPDAVFLKGGFVGVPVGIAAALLRVPFITHDSDAIPGLANRLVGRWARVHAVAQPIEGYAYPPANTVQVGVIVADEFQMVDPHTQKHFKTILGLPPQKPLLVVTGGSSGAQRLNAAMVQVVPKLLHDYPKLQIIHQAGQDKTDLYGPFTNERLHVVDFMKPMYQFTGAADVVVARSSANTLAELGVQGRAVIAVANPLLTDGHQLKNAQKLADKQAVISVEETAQATNASQLDDAIRSLLDAPRLREELAANLHESVMQGAAAKIASLLVEVRKK
jgi:UDP-N-acetylglucosamine--N-acetylmuramyl-(pentapeptide) pyrophosphoryl-undecaprenol N-acetylglucosamine transferase